MILIDATEGTVIIERESLEVVVTTPETSVLVVREGPQGPPGPNHDTTWTLVGDTDPGDPSLLSNPNGMFSSPLWIDTSEDGGGGGGGSGDIDWTVPDLQNGWVDYTGSAIATKPSVYRKTGGGIVQVEGTIAPGRTGAVMFSMPTGYRPDEGRLTFTVPCDTGECRVDVMTTGDVVHVSGEPGAWLSLSTISFYGEAGTVEEEEDMYGEHLITWDGAVWNYRGNAIVARPADIPAYNLGSRAVWDTSMDDTVTTPPPLAIFGDVWFPHGDVDPTA